MWLSCAGLPLCRAFNCKWLISFKWSCAVIDSGSIIKRLCLSIGKAARWHISVNWIESTGPLDESKIIRLYTVHLRTDFGLCPWKHRGHQSNKYHLEEFCWDIALFSLLKLKWKYYHNMGSHLFVMGRRGPERHKVIVCAHVATVSHRLPENDRKRFPSFSLFIRVFWQSLSCSHLLPSVDFQTAGSIAMLQVIFRPSF